VSNREPIVIPPHPGEAERALLVGIRQKHRTTPAQPKRLADHHMAELARLTASAGAIVLAQEEIALQKPDPATFISKSRVTTLTEESDALGANLVIFDDNLSPSQQRNLEEGMKRKVIDRAQLILDIFSQRARTAEGKLQVELAQLQYILPRLRGMWKHLDRQAGGIGTRGPGEREIETDRSRILTRIARLQAMLQRVKSHRNEQRKRRMRAHLPAVALVGYTNAGKSTLLNALTDSNVLTQDRLFATLDPTTRTCTLPRGTVAALSDTVGFVSKLPHELVAAFRATLEELCFADLLLQVVDVTSENLARDIDTTNAVIEELGASEKPRLIVWNKADCLDPNDPDTHSKLEGLKATYPGSVVIAAQTGEGLTELRAAMEAALETRSRHLRVRLGYTQYDVLARLHEEADVLEVVYHDDHMEVTADMPGWLAQHLEQGNYEGHPVTVLPPLAAQSISEEATRLLAELELGASQATA